MSGELRVSTGAVVVDPAALAGAAGVLGGAAAQLGEVLLAASRSAGSPALVASAALGPATWGRAQAALAQVGASAAAVAGALAGTAAALRGCATAYAAAEHAAGAAARAGRRAVGLVLGGAVLPVVVAGGTVLVLADVVWRGGPAAGALLVVAGRDAVDGDVDPARLAALAVGAGEGVLAGVGADAGAAARPVGDWLAAHPGAVDALVLATPDVLAGAAPPGTGPVLSALTGSAWPLEDARDAAAVVAAVGLLGPVLRETAVRVRPATSGPSAPARPPRGVAEVLDGVVRQAEGRVPTSDARGYRGRSPEGGTPPARGQVRVERITAGGRTSWVVLVPGTQEWSPVTADGSAAMDLTANVHAVAGRRTAPMEVVLAAMRQSGVRPGEPVLLAGHSQGGLTVAELAADADVRAEFTITHVVTAGAPVALAEVPGQVQVLALEHGEDVVPLLDGAQNPDTPSWTTVRRDLAADPRWAQRVGADPLAAHGSLAYVDTAELVDAGDDPALRRWLDSAAAFWDRPGARVEVRDFRGERAVPAAGADR